MSERRSMGWGRRAGLAAAVIVAALSLRVADANPAQSQSTILKAWRVGQDPGLDPSADVWGDVPSIDVPLTAQQATYPIGGGSVASVKAEAIHHQDRLYLRLSWADDTRDVTTTGVTDFADASAVELPSVASATVPSVCMGQAGAGVNIWHWRADRQPDLAALNPGDEPVVDYYPSPSDLWYTARAAGNPYAVVTDNPVQDLAAQSFGTIGPTPEQPVQGMATYRDGEWAVVFSRPFASAGAEQPAFAVGDTTDVAFAVWDGSNGDRNGQKQVSQFVRLQFSGESPTPGWEWLPIAAGLVLAVGILAFILRGEYRSP